MKTIFWWGGVLAIALAAGMALGRRAAAQSDPVPLIDGRESDWVDLFDGRTMDGWRAAESPTSFKVVDGTIAGNGPRAHLFYDGPVRGADFKNFELSLEVMTRPGANSGVYFHTKFQERDWPSQGFEVQVNNSQAQQGNYLELKKTGSLYGLRNVHKRLVRDDTWFTLRILVRGPTVRVWLNDLFVVDYRQPVEEVHTSSGSVERLGHGTFGLQCHDAASQVFFRNIRVKVLRDDDPGEPGASPGVDGPYVRNIELAGKNFPLINLHAHLKGGLTLDDLLKEWRRSGLNYGVAVNCGVGFPITNDAGIRTFLDQTKGQPVFVGMQAEGREWVRLFSPEARRQFDYVFTDAMTFTDVRGRRTRLWIRDEVEVGDKQAFMDYLVDRIVEILTNEPIDLYVNPTFLPEVIAAEYDALWTEGRMRRVIDAAAKRGVAIEINGRYRIPSETFLRLAKQAGIKFTFGSNNGGRADLNALEYCFEMQGKLGLSWEDMFVPQGRR